MKISEEQLYKYMPIVEAHKMAEYPSDDELPKHKFSKRFERKMKRLIKDQKWSPRKRKILFMAKRVAVFLLISSTLTFSCLMSVEAFRMKVIEIVTEVFEDLTHFSFLSPAESLDEMGDLTFTYLPEEMEQVGLEKDDNALVQRVYFEDTENVAEWEFTSSDINEWFIGTAVSNIEGNMGSLYVTNDNGVTNAYTTPDAYNYGNVYASTIIEFGEGEGYMLSYDWKAGGNYNNYLKIYLMPTNIELSNTSLPSSSYEITSNKFGSDSWVRDTVLLDNSYSNTVKKLVFMWCTYGSYNGTVYNPPAAIDNIKFEVRNCVEITDLALTAEDGGESANIKVSFTDPNEAGNYVI